jgi:hypothetical protein
MKTFSNIDYSHCIYYCVNFFHYCILVFQSLPSLQKGSSKEDNLMSDEDKVIWGQFHFFPNGSISVGAHLEMEARRYVLVLIAGKSFTANYR